MSELCLMTTICDRNQTLRFLAFYKDYGVTVTLLTFLRVTASSDVLEYF